MTMSESKLVEQMMGGDSVKAVDAWAKIFFPTFKEEFRRSILNLKDTNGKAVVIHTANSLARHFIMTMKTMAPCMDTLTLITSALGASSHLTASLKAAQIQLMEDKAAVARSNQFVRDDQGEN
jgi:hypothetical protein